MDFVQSASDPCIYTSQSKDGLFILAVYVDDIVLAGKSLEHISQVKADIEKKFDLKDMGELHYFLGVNVIQNAAAGDVWIGQPNYAQAILKKFGMNECKAVSTPVTPGTKLLQATNDSEMVDKELYQSAVGSLIYLSGWTRPDITFAVSYVARFCANPTQQHWTAVKRIFRYVNGTYDYGLRYCADKGDGCVGYCDADWAGDITDRKSTSGYDFMVSGSAIAWKSKK